MLANKGARSDGAQGRAERINHFLLEASESLNSLIESHNVFRATSHRYSISKSLIEYSLGRLSDRYSCGRNR
jgi:hypothetical protein